MNDEHLLSEIGGRREHDVAAVGLDVVHELDEGPVMANIPENIRKKNQKCEPAAEPEPFVCKDAALRGQ